MFYSVVNEKCERPISVFTVLSLFDLYKLSAYNGGN